MDQEREKVASGPEEKSRELPLADNLSQKPSIKKKSLSFQAYEELHENQPPTSYFQTLMHLLKGNIGTGCFAMAEAVKNSGLIVGPILILLIAVICVHVQHMLIRCAEFVKRENQLEMRPDFAETIEMSFSSSKNEKWHKWAPVMKMVCNAFICITQLGFCAVYFVFVAMTMKDVLDHHGLVIDHRVIIVGVLIPIWLSSLVRKLKYIAIFSGVATVCMAIGIFATLGLIARDMPPIQDSNYVSDIIAMPLFFGTALFAFEGIALVLPLQNTMKNPEKFSKPLGVLNVGMAIVTAIFIIIGIVGFWKYGESTKGSLTLNLEVSNEIAQFIRVIVAVGVLLGYALQVFVPVQIMFPFISEKIKFAEKNPIYGELILRTMLVLLTFVIAEAIPNLSLLLALIGSVCCVVLAFVLPVVAELIILSGEESGIGMFNWVKNAIILLIALAGFILGGAVSLKQIVEQMLE